MNILYYFKDLPNAMYQWQHYHIINELKLSGHNINIFSPMGFDTVQEANEELIKTIKKSNYSLFMTAAKDGEIFSETLQEIRKLSIPSLLICFDNLTVPFNHKKISPCFDLVWLTSIETKYMFDKWGAKTIFLPYAANPHIIEPTYNTDIERVLFIGTPYGSRCKMINTLLNSNIEVSLFGNPNTTGDKNLIPNISKKNLIKESSRMLSFKIGRKLLFASIKNKVLKQSLLNTNSESLEQHSPVNVIEMMRLYNQYSLSLSSVTNKHTGVLKNPVLIANLRSFEIPAAGGLLFCQYNPELSNYFEDKKEAVYYNSNEEMVDLARYYLSDNRLNERIKIKKQARIKLENEHTWTARFKKIFDTLNLR